jgi:hypothetical protein
VVRKRQPPKKKGNQSRRASKPAKRAKSRRAKPTRTTDKAASRTALQRPSASRKKSARKKSSRKSPSRVATPRAKRSASTRTARNPSSALRATALVAFPESAGAPHASRSNGPESNTRELTISWTPNAGMSIKLDGSKLTANPTRVAVSVGQRTLEWTFVGAPGTTYVIRVAGATDPVSPIDGKIADDANAAGGSYLVQV